MTATLINFKVVSRWSLAVISSDSSTVQRRRFTDTSVTLVVSRPWATSVWGSTPPPVSYSRVCAARPLYPTTAAASVGRSSCAVRHMPSCAYCTMIIPPDLPSLPPYREFGRPLFSRLRTDAVDFGSVLCISPCPPVSARAPPLQAKHVGSGEQG